MLTSDLVRARVLRGEVRPRYVDPHDPSVVDLATRLIDVFQAHVGRTRAEMQEQIDAVVGEGTLFMICRGLSKLLQDRCVFGVDAPIDPMEIRRAVFAVAAKSHPVAMVSGDVVHTTTRDKAIADASAALGLEPAVVERGLYADLESAQVLQKFDTLSPESLLDRYNVALAQAVLFRATRVTVEIAPGDPSRFRQIFRWVKFFRLMHTLQGDRDRGYTLVLDGPASVLQLSSKYGLQLAEFLPALLLATDWTLSADLRWGRERRALTLRIASDQKLRSHYPDHGAYITDEEAHLQRRMETSKSDWQLERRAEIIDLGPGGVLVPDFVLRHRLDGREAWVDVVGFWRKGWLESRLQAIRAYGPKNLILVVSSRLRTGDEDDPLSTDLIKFRDVVPIRELLERAEQVAMRRADSSERPAEPQPIFETSPARRRSRGNRRQ